MTDNALAKASSTAELAPAQERNAAAMALAEQARAGVEARALVALRRPRNIDVVRDELLRDCKRPTFANAALYSMPIGDDRVEGLSIRFAEACVQAMGNLEVDVSWIHDDDERVKLLVAACDLEKNTRITATVDVPKVVIRKRPPKDKRAIVDTRINSWGDLTYIVRADEQAIRPKINAEVSKAMRTAVLRLIPGWLKDEAIEQIRATMRDQAAEDPDAYRRKIVDAFSALGVRPAALGTYLGHDLGEASPDELLELRAVYSAVKDGIASWADILAAKTGEAPEDDEEAQGAASDLMAKIAATKERLGSKKSPRPGPQGDEEAPAKASGRGNSKAKGGTRRASKRAKKPEPENVPDATFEEAPTEPAPGDEAPEVEDVPAHHKGLTPEQIEQGWEVDPATGEVVPPVGADG